MITNINLAVDCMGSETSLNEILEGINESALRNENLFFTLFGKSVDIEKVLKDVSPLNIRSEVVNCDEEVLMSDRPTDAIKLKKNSSMQLSIEHVSNGKSHAVLSCGNTGALMAISLLKLRTIANIKRPSIASIWHNIRGESIVLDLGANIKNDSTSLVDNAILGSALAKTLLSKDEPTIGLLNVGIEEMKGNENVQKASEVLTEMNNKKQLNYYGFVEGASFGNNGADAVHCHMTNTSITDPEILEWYYPVRLTEFSIRKKSGGKGKWFGGHGVIRKIVFLKNLDLTLLSNRRIIKPFGMLNRNNASTGENIIVKKNNRIKLAHACQIKVSKGDTIILKTPGGAGYA